MSYRFDGPFAFDEYSLGARYTGPDARNRTFVCSTKPLPSREEVFADYQARCSRVGLPSASREMYERENLFLTQDELARDNADKFLASLHPDGSNLAGYGTTRQQAKRKEKQ